MGGLAEHSGLGLLSLFFQACPSGSSLLEYPGYPKLTTAPTLVLTPKGMRTQVPRGTFPACPTAAFAPRIPLRGLDQSLLQPCFFWKEGGRVQIRVLPLPYSDSSWVWEKQGRV